VKISVDYERCEGHGLCAEQAPAIFSLDDNAELTYHFEGDDVPAGLHSMARAAISSCPVATLREQS
jgi:ferredoxin